MSRTDHKAVVCEGMSTQWACPDGQRLSVTSALWGRGDRSTCSRGSDESTMVPFKNVTMTLRQLCDNRSHCDVTAEATALGLPAPGAMAPSTYLIANYSCKSISCSFFFVTFYSTPSLYFAVNLLPSLPRKYCENRPTSDVIITRSDNALSDQETSDNISVAALLAINRHKLYAPVPCGQSCIRPVAVTTDFAAAIFVIKS